MLAWLRREIRSTTQLRAFAGAALAFAAKCPRQSRQSNRVNRGLALSNRGQHAENSLRKQNDKTTI